MAYATVSQLKAYLGIAADDDDALLTQLLESATAAVNAYTGQVFAAAEATRTYGSEAVAGSTLYLDTYLQQIDRITVDGVDIDRNTCTLIPRHASRYHAITRAEGWGNTIAVTGRWGWSDAPPADIVHAVIRWAAYMYRQRDAQVFDTTALPDAGVITVPAGIPADVRVLLERYKGVL